MNQRQLERAIARITGESVEEIRHIGFSELVLKPPRRSRRRRKNRSRRLNHQPVHAITVA